MEEKKAYQEKKQAQLHEWDAKIEVLKAKAEKAEAGLKITYQEQIQKLQEKKKVAQEKLHELMGAGEETWGEVKVAVEEIWDDIHGVFNKLLHKEEDKKEEDTTGGDKGAS